MLTVMEKVDLLQSAELFREIRTQSLSSIAAIAREVDLGPRQLLYAEGEAVDALYVLLEGEIEVSSSGGEERRLNRFEVAGALSLLADLPHSETARTSVLTRTLRIGQQDLMDLLAEDVHITRGILRAFVRMIPVRR
jgi:CRP-like cAMP-binding protein